MHSTWALVAWLCIVVVACGVPHESPVETSRISLEQGDCGNFLDYVHGPRPGVYDYDRQLPVRAHLQVAPSRFSDFQSNEVALEDYKHRLRIEAIEGVDRVNIEVSEMLHWRRL